MLESLMPGVAMPIMGEQGPSLPSVNRNECRRGEYYHSDARKLLSHENARSYGRCSRLPAGRFLSHL